MELGKAVGRKRGETISKGKIKINFFFFVFGNKNCGKINGK